MEKTNNSPEILWQDRKRTVFGLPISFTKYILTERKLIVRNGFLNIHETEVELYRILDKSLKMSLGQRIFGCGTVLIHSKDVDSASLEVKSVKDPRGFMAVLEENVDRQRDKYRTRGRDMIGGGEYYEAGDDD